MDLPAECVEQHEGQFLVCAEKGRCVRFEKQPKRVAQKIRVDGCVIKQKTSCDYLVLDWKQRKHFVELKGKDVDHAFEQLEATIPEFETIGSNDEIWCFIVCSESPRTTSKVQVRKAKFAKRFSARLVVKTDVCEHVLTE
jgi:hypothetical protein